MEISDQSGKLELPLEGMRDAHCAFILDQALEKIEGLNALPAELNNNRVLIHPSSPVLIQEAIARIEELGYRVPVKSAEFPVLHMSCASCALSAEEALNEVDGVLKASVNYGSGLAKVSYLPSIANPYQLQAAVQDYGYDLYLSESNEEGALRFEDLQRENMAILKRNLIISAILTVPVFILGMFFMHSTAGIGGILYVNILMAILSTPVVFWSGRSFFRNAWKLLRHRSANMDTLVALSTGVAYVYSLFNTFAPGVWKNAGLESHVYFEAAAVIITFILFGKYLEEKAKYGTSSAIRSLIGLQPDTVWKLGKDGEEQIVPIQAVIPGDRLIVKPGERIAVDGELEKGETWIDESMLSGEPIPVHKTPGTSVFAGTINQQGTFQYTAKKVGSETRLARIIQLVKDAQGSKAPVQKLVDRIAAIFVPSVLIIAALSFGIWLIAGGAGAFPLALKSFITVVVIACPCALGLATPTAIMVGIGKAAGKGILIKDAESMEQLCKVNAVVLDKTGTITEGKPEVIDAIWFSQEERLQTILFSMEKRSEHPLASAICNYLGALKMIEPDFFENQSGLGLKAVFDGNTYYVGSPKMLDRMELPLSAEFNERLEAMKQDAMTLIVFFNDQDVYAIFGLEDKVKSGSKEAIEKLKARGLELHMLTGDQQISASAVANALGLTSFVAGASPEDKQHFVKRLQDEGKIVAMIGDGINDSAALAKSDVSIAMARGSDIAMEVAKVTIMSSDLRQINEALNISQDTVRTIKQNLFWAFLYNILAIPIAAGVLYPSTGFLLNPMLAGAAMALSSVSVVSNSLLLKWKE